MVYYFIIINIKIRKSFNIIHYNFQKLLVIILLIIMIHVLDYINHFEYNIYGIVFT